jgi:YD repeat-containing protein
MRKILSIILVVLLIAEPSLGTVGMAYAKEPEKNVFQKLQGILPDFGQLIQNKVENQKQVPKPEAKAEKKPLPPAPQVEQQQAEQQAEKEVAQQQQEPQVEEAQMEAPQAAGFAAEEDPAAAFNVNQESPKPNTFLDDIRKVEADLFSGAASYAYPLWVPKGRLSMTPAMNLGYSSNVQRYDSIIGFGWSLPTNGIFRSTEKGANHLYTDNDFTADIWGSSEELISTDSGAGEYAPKNEGSFTKYLFQNSAWVATGTNGTKYFFGQSVASRQADPNDANRIYKWMLDRVEDANGNFITLTYFKDAGQIYPETIRYTNHGNDTGIYEIKFTRTDRSPYSNYERGYKTTTNYLIDEIQVYSYDTGPAKLIRSYDLDYTSRNNAVVYLTRITVRSGDDILPSIQLSYYDKTNGAEFSTIDALKEINYPYGAKETLFYKASTAYRINGILNNSGLPFVVHTLYKKTLQPNIAGPAYITQYEYSGGHYYYDNLDAFKKQYAGFHEVTVTDPVGNIQKLFYHQSEFSSDNAESAPKGEFEDHISKRGRVYRSEQYDDQDHLYSVSMNKWEKLQLPDDNPEKERFFVYLTREMQKEYDGNGSERSRAVERTYDAFGNVVQETDFGRVNPTDDAGNFSDLLQDKRVVIHTYASNDAKNIHSLPSEDIKKDFAGTTIGYAKYYYDGLALHQVSIGNKTKTEVLSIAPNTYISTETVFNGFGLPTEYKNARGYSTVLTYDSVNLYPASLINAKSQTMSMRYHYPSGNRSSITDANGAKTTNEYDNFGRITEQKVSNPANPAQLVVQADYFYDTFNQPIGITQNTYAQNNDIDAQPIVVTQKSYFDGLGRPIQVRQEAEGNNQFTVTGRSYDERGNLKKETLPVEESGLAYTAPADGAVGTSYDYDAVNRQIKATNPLGSTSIVYDDWEQRITDPNGKKKDLIFDANRNLITIKEYLGNTPYSTTYEYDANDNLTKITDAENNIRTMTYDLLGRRTALQDLHTSNDSTFGTWTYSYDENGNMISSTDPKNQTIQTTYDELDRPLLSDFTGKNGIEVTYAYDQGQYGIGRLTSVSIPQGAEYAESESVNKTINYDIIGRAQTETLTVGEKNFNTSYAYDLAGNILEVTYPDDLKIRYGFNNAGLIENVTRTEDAVTKNVVNNIEYAPTGAITFISYADGSQTTDTFNINQLYRLTHRETNLNNIKLQDILYTYDAVGNLTNLQDTSETNTARVSTYTYDDLYRLTQVSTTDVASGQDYTQSYTYSILGNITDHSENGAYIYAGGNSNTANGVDSNPHAVTSIGAAQYSYDKNGNLTDDGTWTHTFNFQNFLTTSTDGNKTINYLYDAGGNRILKDNITANKKTYYINNFYDIEESVAKRHIYVNDRKVATVPKKL